MCRFLGQSDRVGRWSAFVKSVEGGSNEVTSSEQACDKTVKYSMLHPTTPSSSSRTGMQRLLAHRKIPNPLGPP